MNNSDIDLDILEQWTRHEPVTWIEMLDLRPGLRNPGRSLCRLAGLCSVDRDLASNGRPNK